MPDLGKAFVQIVPSAEGISGSISGIMKGEADSAGQESGSVFSEKMISTIKTVIAAAGIGTLISTFGAGAVLQLVYWLIRFEPREVRHRSVIEVVKEYAEKAS